MKLLPQCEIERDAPYTASEKIGAAALLLWPLFAIIAALNFCGCKAFYENSGSKVNVGTLTAPVEVSDSSDCITVRALYSMDGAAVWTAKDSKVTVRYDNVYTNSYFAIVKTEGEQHLTVDVEPLYVGEDPTTNAAPAAVEGK